MQICASDSLQDPGAGPGSDELCWPTGGLLWSADCWAGDLVMELVGSFAASCRSKLGS